MALSRLSARSTSDEKKKSLSPESLDGIPSLDNSSAYIAPFVFVLRRIMAISPGSIALPELSLPDSIRDLILSATARGSDI